MSDLNDLNDLLQESVVLAGARRAAKTGRRLSAEQSAALEANNLAEEMEQWLPQEVYAHVLIEFCACGAEHQCFQGWYVYETAKKGKGRRLIQREDHSDLPASLYTTQRAVSYCSKCVSEELEQATTADLDLLEELLGEPVYELLEEEESSDEPQGVFNGTTS